MEEDDAFVSVNGIPLDMFDSLAMDETGFLWLVVFWFVLFNAKDIILFCFFFSVAMSYFSVAKNGKNFYVIVIDNAFR